MNIVLEYEMYKTFKEELSNKFSYEQSLMKPFNMNSVVYIYIYIHQCFMERSHIIL